MSPEQLGEDQPGVPKRVLPVPASAEPPPLSPPPDRFVLRYAARKTPASWAPRAAWLLRMGLAAVCLTVAVCTAFVVPADASFEVKVAAGAAALVCMVVTTLVLATEMDR